MIFELSRRDSGNHCASRNYRISAHECISWGPIGCILWFSLEIASTCPKLHWLYLSTAFSQRCIYVPWSRSSWSHYFATSIPHASAENCMRSISGQCLQIFIYLYASTEEFLLCSRPPYSLAVEVSQNSDFYCICSTRLCASEMQLHEQHSTGRPI